MKNYLSLITLIAVLLFIAGCNDKSKLKGYYDLYRPNDTYPVGAYKFYEDGRCFYYIYDYSTGERDRFYFGDVVPVNTWSYYGDMLTIMGYRYKVVPTSSDTLILNALDRSKDKVLVKSKRQTDE